MQDASDSRIAYCYFVEPQPGYSDDVIKLPRAEALRIVRNHVKLPDPLQQLRN
jgi:hypothetical protein